MILPMLAHDFEKYRSRVGYPALAQPKLDGVRLLAARDRRGPHGTVTMWTRTGKAVPSGAFDGLDSALGPVLGALPPGVCLDGEMYAHGATFEAVASMFKTRQVREPSRVSERLTYFVYDLFDPARPHMEANERLRELARAMVDAKVKAEDVQLLPTAAVADEAQARALHDAFVARGFEGLMLRSTKGAYEPGKRSQNLLKLKAFRTAEFRIAGVEQATGQDAGTAIFVCEAEDRGGKTFRVRMRASRDVRRRHWQEFLANPARFVGLTLTVRFQNLTANGIPRFPIGLAVRDYE